MKALLFGSIGVIVDSSHLQLAAYNQAFEEAGLGWRWEREAYEAMLRRPGGKARLRRELGERDGQAPDEALVDRLHARKSELFQQRLCDGSLSSRPGVRRLMDQCSSAGIKVGLVTTTELDNVRATLVAGGDGVRMERFDVLIHRDLVSEGKPHPAAWHLALDQLGLPADEVVAIEDTAACVDGAVAAGLFTVATPNGFAGAQDFTSAHAVVDCLGDQQRPARQLAGERIVADELVTIERLADRLVQAV